MKKKWLKTLNFDRWWYFCPKIAIKLCKIHRKHRKTHTIQLPKTKILKNLAKKKDNINETLTSRSFGFSIKIAVQFSFLCAISSEIEVDWAFDSKHNKTTPNTSARHWYCWNMVGWWVIVRYAVYAVDSISLCYCCCDLTKCLCLCACLKWLMRPWSVDKQIKFTTLPPRGESNKIQTTIVRIFTTMQF